MFQILGHLLYNIFQLEDFDVEICDEIYEAYTDLLRQQEEDDDTLCYKTYTLVSSHFHFTSH